MKRTAYFAFVVILTLIIGWAAHNAAHADSTVATTQMVTPTGSTVTVNTSSVDAYLALGYSYYPAAGDFVTYYPTSASNIKKVFFLVGDHNSTSLTETTVSLWGSLERITVDTNGTDTAYAVALTDVDGATLFTKADFNSVSGPNTFTYAVSLSDTGSTEHLGVPVIGPATLTVSNLDLTAEVQTVTPNANATRGPWTITWNGETTPSIDEVVTLSEVNEPNGGTFKLTFGGQETAAIAYDATAAVVDAALEALSSIEANEVICTGGPLPDANVVIAFDGGLGGQNVGAVTLTTNSLTATTGGETASFAITVTVAGDGLVYNSSTATVDTALDNLAGLVHGDITVGGETLAAGAMTFTFRDTWGDVDDLVVVDISNLTGPATAPVTETIKGRSGLDKVAVSLYYREDPQ